MNFSDLIQAPKVFENVFGLFLGNILWRMFFAIIVLCTAAGAIIGVLSGAVALLGYDHAEKSSVQVGTTLPNQKPIITPQPKSERPVENIDEGSAAPIPPSSRHRVQITSPKNRPSQFIGNCIISGGTNYGSQTQNCP